MAESDSERGSPETPTAGKKPMGKIVAVIVVILLIVVAIAAWRLLTPGTPPPPTNRAPTIQTVTADRPAGDIGTTVTFTATATDPDTGDTLTYRWDFGDGTNATGSTTTHGYTLAGNFIAVVTVDDGHGHTVSGESKAVFLLVNHPETRSPGLPTDQPNPVAVISADKSVIRAGGSVTFNGKSSWTWWYDGAAWNYVDATNETVVPTLSWDWGDGTAVTTGNATVAGEVTHTFATAGSRFVKLTATNYLSRTDSVGYTVLVTAQTPPSIGVKNPDVFTEVRFGEPDSLDPAYDYETSGGQIIQNVAEGLIFYQGANADVFIPMLASSVPDITDPADVSPDGLTWNFTLKSGVTFHSGNPVNCAAVEFSIERVLVLNDPAGPAWIYDQSLTAYAADDPGTPGVDERMVAIQDSVTCASPSGLNVAFNLAIPYPAFLSTLAFTGGFIIDPDPASYTVTSRCPSTNLMNNYCHDQVVGTGAFSLRTWQPNQQIILDRNPTYHRALANFKEVHVVKANDVATRVLMLKAGDADYIDLPPSHKGDIRDASNQLLPGIAEVSGDTFIVQFLGFNQNINTAAAPPGDVNVPADFFQDVHLRKAFSYAWKYTDFIQNVLFGYGTPLCGPIPKGMFGYDATVPCYSYDLVRAQAEFQQAMDPRTPFGTDTYWDNGFTVTIYYNIGNTVREEGARQLSQTLATLNPLFNVRAQGLEWASFLQAVRDKTPALFFLGWAPDYADPDDYVVPFLRSGQFFPNRVSSPPNATLDAKIDQQSQELNPTVRLQLLQDIQRAPYYDVPYIWLYQSQNYDAMRSWVQGYYSNPMTSAGTGLYYYDLNK